MGASGVFVERTGEYAKVIYFDDHWKYVFYGLLRVALLPLIIAWACFLLLSLFLPRWFLFAGLLLMYVISAKLGQMVFFMADRFCCTDRVQYDKIQMFFHANFENNTTWFRCKLKLLFFFRLAPYHRCRCIVLKIWFHKKTATVKE